MLQELFQTIMNIDLAQTLIIGVIAFVIVLVNIIVIIYIERKVLGDMQWRLSIMRVGKHGILQPIADAIKFMTKEDIIPRKADQFLFVLAPLLFFVPTFMLFTMIPMTENFVAKNMELGLFIFFAILTIMPIGLILAGWSSNNKYSLIGGLRAAAAQISYEIPLLLAVIGIIMLAGSMNLVEIVQSQKGVIELFGVKTFIPKWFIIYQPFGFVLFFIAVLADINRPPFDLPEAESELVAGPFTEYSSMKFVLFLFAEYTVLIAMSAMITIMYLGGWYGPLLPPIVWFLIKTYFVVWLAIWIRGTVPRLRIDQLMNLGWKVLLPLTLLNVTVTGIFILGAAR
ncbi:hypothetical protein LCGC14_1747400 [marine sediment metagenome]|uniref:Uncharacterized protein n=1 Tax=marine sediment metagenome TaxID=412755 RepID=A0A0F9JK31_9ZZZZ